MQDFIREYFTLNFTRTPEGFLSWQHIALSLFGLALMGWLVARALRDPQPLRPLRRAAIVLLSVEAVKLSVFYARWGWGEIVNSNLPLFICSITLYALPVAAWVHGRAQSIALDFLMIFGVPQAFLGTLAAANNFTIFPVLYFNTVVSTITHCLAGFVALYIFLRRLYTLSRRNVLFVAFWLCVFMAVAYVVNQLIVVDTNYMFFERPDGTPFEVVKAWAGGTGPLYALGVALVHVGYVFLAWSIFRWLARAQTKRQERGKTV